jgi:hypothetical protein
MWKTQDSALAQIGPFRLIFLQNSDTHCSAVDLSLFKKLKKQAINNALNSEGCSSAPLLTLAKGALDANNY